jgi:hypothetical protein
VNVKSRTSLTMTADFTIAARLSSAISSGALLTVLLLALPLAAQAQDFSYTIYNGTVTITEYIGPGGAVTIPDTITNFPVVSIAAGAFMGNPNVTSVTISTNVLSIGDDAFDQCYSLTNATIPAGVVSIGDFAFTETALTTVTIPSTLTSLGNGVFNECYSLGAINVAGANSVYSSAGGVLFNHAKTTLIQCPPAFAGSYSIPSTVTTIASDAFDACSGVTNVTIPPGVTSIGDFAFNATGLMSVTVPSGLTSIGSHVFAFCSSLANITIPNAVTSIGPDAFLYCTSLTNATIGSGVTSLGSDSFANCSSLLSAYFNGKAPSGDSTVFAGDNNLVIYFPAHATGWGQYFYTFPTWYPIIQSIGIQTNQFGFNITGNNNLVVVVEACTNLANPAWTPLQTISLSAGPVYFSDPLSRNYSKRFYRLSAP